MNSLGQAIDFTKLVGDVPGEALEGLTRLLAERLNLNPVWTGRGPDGGRDLILTQTFTWPLKVTVRWLVSCKDYAKGGKSVPETDLPSPFDAKLNQYQANGFLLVTTTTISTNAKQVLDSYTNRFFTDVWDRYVDVLRTDPHQAPRFGDELIVEAIRCAQEGLRREDRTFILQSIRSPHQRSLESWQVIVHEEAYRYRFTHEKLQDFLYALEAVKKEWMPAQVVEDIGQLRTRTILPWMVKLYPIHCPSRRAEFMRKAFDV